MKTAFVTEESVAEISAALRQMERRGLIRAFATENRRPDSAASFRYRIWVGDCPTDGLVLRVREAGAFVLGTRVREATS